MDVVRAFNNEVCRWVLRLLDQARNKLAIRFNNTDSSRVLDIRHADNRVRTLENLFVAVFKDLIAQQNKDGFSVVAFFREGDSVSESLLFILPEIRRR